jgi:hypothetical protein
MIVDKNGSITHDRLRVQSGYLMHICPSSDAKDIKFRFSDQVVFKGWKGAAPCQYRRGTSESDK